MHELGKFFAQQFLSHVVERNAMRLNVDTENENTVSHPFSFNNVYNNFPQVLKIASKKLPVLPKEQKEHKTDTGGFIQKLLTPVSHKISYTHFLTLRQSTQLTTTETSNKNQSSLSSAYLANSALLTTAIIFTALSQKNDHRSIHETINELKEYIASILEKRRFENELKKILTEPMLLNNDDLEYILEQYHNDNQIIASVLNQNQMYRIADTDIVYEGTLIGALFVKVLINFTNRALEIFCKRDTLDKIKMKLYKNNRRNSYPLLPLSDEAKDIHIDKALELATQYTTMLNDSSDKKALLNLLEAFNSAVWYSIFPISNPETRDYINHTMSKIAFEVHIEDLLQKKADPFNIYELNNILTQFNNKNSIVHPTLCKKVVYQIADTDILYTGNLLGALFFKAMINFNLKHVKLFIEHDTVKEIKMALYRDKDKNKIYPLLSPTVTYCDRSVEKIPEDLFEGKKVEEKLNYYIDLLVQHNLLSNDIEKELCKTGIVIAVRNALIDHVFIDPNEIFIKKEKEEAFLKLILNQKRAPRLIEDQYCNYTILKALVEKINNKDDTFLNFILEQPGRWGIVYYNNEKKSGHFKEICEGPLINMFFLRTVTCFDSKGLQTFLKYNMHKNLGMDFINSQLKKSLTMQSDVPSFDFCLTMLLWNVKVQSDDQIIEKYKKQFTKNTIRAFKKIEWVTPKYNNQQINLEHLEKVLLLFNEGNPAITTVLNQKHILQVYRSENRRYEPYTGTLLQILFFYSALSLKADVLEMLFNHNISVSIEGGELKNSNDKPYMSLPTCLTLLVIDEDASHELSPILERMPQTARIRAYNQCKEFLKYVIKKSKLRKHTDLEFDYIRIILPQPYELKSENPYYTKENIFSIINSEMLYFQKTPRRLLKIAFLGNQTSIKKSLDEAGEILYNAYGKKDLYGRTLKDVVAYIRLVLSYGAFFKREEITEWYRELSTRYKLREAKAKLIKKHKYNLSEEEWKSPLFSISEKKYKSPLSCIEAILNEEIDLRERFIQFDEQEDPANLLQQIVEHCEEPVTWMRAILKKTFKKTSKKQLLGRIMKFISRETLEENCDLPSFSLDTLVTHCIKHVHKLLEPIVSNKNYIAYLERWIGFITLFLEQGNYLDGFIEKSKIKKANQKLLGESIVKIIEYNYFNQLSDQENSTVLKPFLRYCLNADNPESPLPNLHKKGNQGNAFHIAARTGLYNKTAKEIMEIGISKHEELEILKALTESFASYGFTDGHTPIQLAKEELNFAIRDNERDYTKHEEIVTIIEEFINHCAEKISAYKKCPHIAYSPLEDEFQEHTMQCQKEFYEQERRLLW